MREAEERPSRRRRVLVPLAVAVGLVMTASLVVVASWPVLLEKEARARVEKKLRSRFDVVEMGCFELGRDHLRMCHVHLEKDSVKIDVPVAYADFHVDWGFEPRIVLEKATSKGGTLVGEWEDLEKMRDSSPGNSTGSGGTGRIDSTGLEIEAADLEIDLVRGEHQLETVVSVRGTRELLDVNLSRARVARGGEMLASAEYVETKIDPGAPFPATVSLGGATMSRGGLEARDVEGSVTLHDEKLEVLGLHLNGTSRTSNWAIDGTVRRNEGRVDLALKAEGVRPAQLPGAARLPLDPEHGEVAAQVSVKGTREEMSLEGLLVVKGAHLMHPRLANDPVVLSQKVEVDAVLNLDARELVLERAVFSSLEHPGVSMSASGRVLMTEALEDREMEMTLEMPRTSCQEVLDAVPPGLAPALEKFELSGEASLEMRVVAKMSDPDATVLEGGLNIDSCKIENVPKTVASLDGPFNHVVKMKDGRTQSRLLARGDARYTPYDRMPPAMVAAVLSTEDGGFFRHDGFIESQFEASLKRNIELGRFRRGGSTITMQMVKNVLLTHEKTVSRKLQELFLTWVIERRLSKERIMEIYLNVVEFGPGIYGVGDAADHYFGKSPLELTSRECAFLATLLPRPVERHEMWCRGELTEKHERYVGKVHRRMLGRGRITRDEYDLAEDTPIEFSRRGWSGEAACLADGRRLAEGTHTQGALSGLLWGSSG